MTQLGNKNTALKVAKVSSIDEDGVVYGFAIVCLQKNATSGEFEPYFDLQDEHIPERVMTKAVHEFMRSGAAVDAMHDEVKIGKVRQSIPMTSSLAKQHGFTGDQYGWIVGVECDDPRHLALFKSGKWTGFSIGGFAARKTYQEGTCPECGAKLGAGNCEHQPGATAKSAAPGTAGKRRVITDLELKFLSGVDLPAQEGATVRAIKSAAGAGVRTMKTVEELLAENADLLTKNADLAKRVERAEKIALLTDAEKAFVKTLDNDEKPNFVGKSRSERIAIMKAAEDADPMYYTAKSGEVFRQSQKRLGDMAKRLDEAEAREAEVVKTARAERISKRVASLANLSDDEGCLTALVKAAESIEDDKVRAAANKALDLCNEAAASVTTTVGTKKGKTGGDVSAEKTAFEAYVDELATKKNISRAEAHSFAVTKDRKGMQLQKAWRDAQNANRPKAVVGAHLS